MAPISGSCVMGIRLFTKRVVARTKCVELSEHSIDFDQNSTRSLFPGSPSVLRYFGRYPAMGSARYRWGETGVHGVPSNKYRRSIVHIDEFSEETGAKT